MINTTRLVDLLCGNFYAYLDGELDLPPLLMSVHMDSVAPASNKTALRTGGVAVVRLYYDVPRYVLLTGVLEDKVLMFDPYYQTQPFPESEVVVTLAQPFSYNRIVPFSSLNRLTNELYSLGSMEEREAVLLFNEQAKLTEEKTIEFYI